MIKNSFIFLEKVGKRKEKSIWKQGIKDWHNFLQAKNVKGISMEKKFYYNRKVKEAQEALLNEDSAYFVGKMPQVEIWRLYDYFKEECGYLDVEVDSYGKVVLVGISDYYHSNFFVKGVNLSKVMIEKELSKYKLLITFNGGSFDLPKLRKQFGIENKMPHLDLKPLCVNLGLKGGLKIVEEELGLKRPPHLKGNPVSLWKAFHASGDQEYLDLLIEYNREDIENLKGVMSVVYKKLHLSLMCLLKPT
ncbi:MAG: ribonuclease H-like domain-containing protein [Nanoarchaeota archaeon]|nr:ribonuclease H-like domain-containing protein [Nanoarchaeota archaeon]MBU1622995.1 ribonuclease H-like domain-containing protein [Nanoarchaeota archaeon]MBU1974664.1 ribonuclease H-like domain-containing protein [Nanoarchaeota archaeon]